MFNPHSKICFIAFRERGEEGGGEREKNRQRQTQTDRERLRETEREREREIVRETLRETDRHQCERTLVSSCMCPNLGTEPQPRYVP